MRRLSLATGSLLVLALALPASAQMSMSPGYTAQDKAQFAKLAEGVGTWTCVDTPASKKADVVKTTLAGNWYISRETGDFPNTTYTRWNHSLKRYVSVTIGDEGATFVYQTTDSDPNNATWTPTNPFNVPANRQALPSTVTLSGNTMTSVGKFRDAKGNIVSYKSVCTKS